MQIQHLHTPLAAQLVLLVSLALLAPCHRQMQQLALLDSTVLVVKRWHVLEERLLLVPTQAELA